MAACDVLGWCPSEGWRKRNRARFGPQHRCRCARGMLRVPAKGGKTDTTTCTAPFGDLGCAPLTELRPEGTQRPGGRLLSPCGRRFYFWVPQLFFRQPQSSGGDKGALTAVRRCSEGQTSPPRHSVGSAHLLGRMAGTGSSFSADGSCRAHASAASALSPVLSTLRPTKPTPPSTQPS